MVILCGSYMFDVVLVGYENKGGGSREVSGTFMCNTTCQRIEN